MSWFRCLWLVELPVCSEHRASLRKPWKGFLEPELGEAVGSGKPGCLGFLLVIWLGPNSWNVVCAGYGRTASSSPIRIDLHPSVTIWLHPCLPEAPVSIIYACWKRLKATFSLLGRLSNHCPQRTRSRSTLQKCKSLMRLGGEHFYTDVNSVKGG